MSLYIKYFLPKIVQGQELREVFHYVMDDGPKKGATITCYLTLDYDGQADEIRNLGKFVWNGILAEFTQYEGSILEGVKKSLTVGVNKARNLLKNNKSIVEKGVNFEMTLVSVWDGNMYVAFVGDHDLIVYRGAERLSITELLRSHKVSSGSVAIYDEDVILISATDPEIEWDEPEKLFENLELDAGSNEMENGLVFLSRGINFDELVNKKEVLGIPDVEDTEDKKDNLFELSSQEDTEVVEDVETDELGYEVEEDEIDELGHTEPQEVEDAPIQEEPKGRSKPGKLDEVKKAVASKLLPVTKVINEKAPALKTIFSKIGPFLSRIWDMFIALIASISDLLSRLGQGILSLTDRSLSSKPWYKRMRAKLSQSSLGPKPDLRKIKVGGHMQKQKQNKRLGVVVLIIISIILVSVGVKRTKEKKAAEELHTQYIAYQTDITDYLADAQSNIRGDKDKAETALFKATEAYNTPTVDISTLTEEDAAAYTSIEQQILQLEDELYKRTPISDNDGMEVFVDGKLSFGADTNPTDISIYKDSYLAEYIYVTDAGENALFYISTDGSIKRTPDSSKALSNPLFVDVGNSGAYVYDGTNGVVQAPYVDNSGVLGEIEILSGAGVGDFNSTSPSDFAIFTVNDNAYLLSQDQHAILKAQRVSSGAYGLPYTYFSDDSLSNAKDLFGDFSIYVLTGGASGFNAYAYDTSIGALAESNLSISGLRQSFEDLTAGYTGGSLDFNIYLFDRAEKRILIFEKPDPQADRHPGQLLFVKELVYRGGNTSVFADVKDIVVDKTETNLYVLDGSKIWRIPL